MDRIKKHRGLKRYYKNLANKNDLDKATGLDFDNPETWFEHWHFTLTGEATVPTVSKEENHIWTSCLDTLTYSLTRQKN